MTDRLQEIEGRLDSALEVAQRALQVLASATRVSGGEDVYTEEVARQDYAARHSRQALDDLLSARRIAKQLRAGLAHVCGDPSTPQPSNGDVCLSCEQLRASGAVSGAAAQPAPSGTAHSGSQEVTEADGKCPHCGLRAVSHLTCPSCLGWMEPLRSEATPPNTPDLTRRSPREGAAPTPGDTVWQNEGASAAAETLRRETTGRRSPDQPTETTNG